MKRFLFLSFILVLSCFTCRAYAVSNDVTITSYYPSPFGTYEQIRLFPQNPLTGTCNNGSLYFENATDTLQICKNNLWTSITGLWSMNSRNPGFDPQTSARVDQYFLSQAYPDLTVRKPFLGIGTDNPQRPLHIVIDDGGTPVSVAIENLSNVANSGAALSFSGVLDGQSTQNYVNLQAVYQNLTAAAAESSLSILVRDGTGTGMKEQFTFKGNGFLGIRNPTPLAIVDLAGNAIDLPVPVANTLPYLKISTDGLQINSGNVLTVLANGNVGINQQNPTQLLEIGGNIRATTLILASDGTLKKNIVPITNALEKVSRLKGVSFEWKENFDDNRKKMGVIAQDVEKVFPEIVYGQEGSKGVDYPSLIAPLIEAVKELKIKNDALRQKLLTQSELINAQEIQIKSLQDSLSDKEVSATP